MERRTFPAAEEPVHGPLPAEDADVGRPAAFVVGLGVAPDVRNRGSLSRRHRCRSRGVLCSAGVIW